MPSSIAARKWRQGSALLKWVAELADQADPTSARLVAQVDGLAEQRLDCRFEDERKKARSGRAIEMRRTVAT